MAAQRIVPTQAPAIHLPIKQLMCFGVAAPASKEEPTPWYVGPRKTETLGNMHFVLKSTDWSDCCD